MIFAPPAFAGGFFAKLSRKNIIFHKKKISIHTSKVLFLSRTLGK